MTAYVRPESLEAALQARAAHPDFVILAGGTDLLVDANHRAAPIGVIDVFGLDALCRIDIEDDGAIVVGGAVTYWQLLASDVIRRELPCLAAAAREIGALQIQARGTIGGNIATSSPVGDSLPTLLALDAELLLASTSGERVVPYDQFCTGYRVTELRDEELVVGVRFPARPEGLRQYWRKVGTRRAQSISKVMLAASGRVRRGVVDHVRIALGAVADRPMRAKAVEAVVEGGTPGPQLAEAAAAVLASEITPIDDVRSRAVYRMKVAQNLVSRFVCWLGAQQE